MRSYSVFRCIHKNRDFQPNGEQSLKSSRSICVSRFRSCEKHKFSEFRKWNMKRSKKRLLILFNCTFRYSFILTFYPSRRAKDEYAKIATGAIVTFHEL